MSHHTHARPRRSSVGRALGLTVAVAVLATGCGSVGEPEPATAEAAAAKVAAAPKDGAPQECQAAFPVAVRRADLDELRHRPNHLGAPPVRATLCETSSTMDDQVEIASYATDATPDQVLDAYADELAAYDAVREDRGAGETVSATVDGTSVEITPRDGAFTVAMSVS